MKYTHERSKRVEEGENGFFLSTKEKVGERGREIERRDGRYRKKFAEPERAAAARRSGIHGRFVLVQFAIKHKKKAEGETSVS